MPVPGSTFEHRPGARRAFIVHWTIVALTALCVFVLNELHRARFGIATNQRLVAFFLIHFACLIAMASAVVGLLLIALRR